MRNYPLVRTLKLSLLACVFAFSAHAYKNDLPETPDATVQLKRFNLSEFAKIPVMQEGRIKPMDTFARTTLLLLNGRSKLPNMSATEWLTELLFDSSTAYRRAVFHIPHPGLQSSLRLPRRPKSRYSFLEFQAQLRDMGPTIEQLMQQPREKLTAQQAQLVRLHTKASYFFEMSRSLSFFWPILKIDRQELAGSLGLKPSHDYSYYDLLKHTDAIKTGAAAPERDEEEREYLENLQTKVRRIEEFGISRPFKVVPPQWPRDGVLWRSPSEVLTEGRGSPQTAKLFQLWQQLSFSFAAGDTSAFDSISKKLQSEGNAAFAGTSSESRLKVEYYYNKFDLFTKSTILYVLSFLFLLVSFMFWRGSMQSVAFGAAAIGLILHSVSLLMRMYIMQRPPVTTLYESIIFVALVAVIFGLFFERIRQNGLGTMIASVLGASLLFVSFGYAAEGDTLGVLVAVLNTNFWLATHVVCMTIGYGCCLVGGVMGHVYLIRQIWQPAGRAKKAQGQLYKNMLGASLVALFFSMFGTILGGIWADQSWGRFWGWDPKENGAMWIVLWLLFLLHGRIAGIVHATGFALGMVLTNIIVALAWFGVNLLGVGLHSYGFTENIATNLALFCGFEMVLGVVLYHMAKVAALKQKVEVNQNVVAEQTS